MMNSRTDIEAKSGSYQALAHEVESTFKNIRRILANAFADGKEKPTGIVAHQVGLFNSLWDKLDKYPSDSLEHLNHFFAERHKHLKDIIESYCFGVTPATSITPQIRTMLNHSINIYHAIAKQKYFLEKLKNSNYQKLIDDLVQIKEKENKFNDAISGGDEVKIKKMIGSFKKSLRELIKAIGEQLSIAIEQTEDDQEQEFDPLPEFEAILRDLPEANSLNNLTQQLKDAVDSSKGKIANEYEALINKQIKLLKELNDKTIKSIDAGIHAIEYYKNAANHAYTQGTIVLAEMGTAFNTVEREFGYVNQMRGVDTTQTIVSPGYQEVKEMASAFPRQDTVSQMALYLQTLEQSFEEFLFSYSAQDDYFEDIKKMLEEKGNKLQEFPQFVDEIDHLSKGAEELKVNFSKAYLEVQNVLRNHIEAALNSEDTWTYLKRFWDKHVIKVGVGTGAGITGTILLGALHFTNPFTTFVLGFGLVVFGFAGGGLAGAAKDQIDLYPGKNAIKIPNLEGKKQNARASDQSSFYSSGKAFLYSIFKGKDEGVRPAVTEYVAQRPQNK